MNSKYNITEEEFDYLCHIIGGKSIKIYFDKNSKEFGKIKPGFRAKSLSDSDAVALFIKFKEKPFIYSFVDGWIDNRLNEINNLIERKKKEGTSYGEACAAVLMNSVFSDNIRLYFKLSEIPTEEILYDLLSAYKGSIENSSSENEKLQNRINELNLYIKSQSQSHEETVSDKDIEIKRQCEEISELEALLEEENDKLQKLEAELRLKSRISDDGELRALYDDSRAKEHLYVNLDVNFSICEVSHPDYNQKIWLNRIADIDRNGQISLFHFDHTKPRYYDNRKRLYRNGGPSEPGSVGLWEWYSEPKWWDSTKDNIKSTFKAELIPIEIVTVEDCHNIDEIVKCLKCGYEHNAVTGKVLVSFEVTKGQYTGVLCCKNEIKKTDGKITLSDDVIRLPVYEFTSRDIIQLNDKVKILKSVIMGTPVGVYQVKSTNDIIKDIVLGAVSFDSYKQAGFINTEYETLKQFIKTIRTESVIDEICKKCHCEEQTAKILYDDFIKNVMDYINGKSIENDLITTALRFDEDLMVRAKNLIRSEWESEHTELINSGERELNDISSQIKTAETQLREAQTSLESVKAAETQIQNSIAEKERLAADVENAVEERICRARENAADFIAEMAFVCGTPKKTENDVYESEAKYELIDIAIEQEKTEAHNNWTDVIETAMYALQDAGVKECYSRGLSAYLCAAYIAKQPILLAGPNSDDIVEAFSAAICTGRYGVLRCEGKYSQESVNKIGANGEAIVKLSNVISSGWVCRLPEIISKKDIFFIATHPYSEDVQIEPKSMYSYILPIFTEFFIENAAVGEYYGGYFGDDFKAYNMSGLKPKRIKLLSCLDANMLVINKLQTVISIMHDIYESDFEADFLFSVFPMAYSTMNVDRLMRNIADKNIDADISDELKQDLKFVLGEEI